MEEGRHPSEFFIKYLLTLTIREAQDDNWVRDRVKQIGYPPPSPQYVNALRRFLAVDFPVDYDPSNRFNRPTVKFLRNQGIWTLHDPNDDTKEAMRILVEPQIRKIVEQLLLGRLDTKEIATRVNSRFRKFYTGDVIADYGHYFWNCSIMKTHEWVQFFEAYEHLDQQRNLSILQSGGSMALHVAGFKQEVESKDMLREMLETITFDFKDWRNAPRSLDRTRAFATLAKAATEIDERMSESSTAVRDHLALFRNWQMTHTPKVIQGIEDIAPHGNFSDSGADLKELPEKTK